MKQSEKIRSGAKSLAMSYVNGHMDAQDVIQFLYRLKSPVIAAYTLLNVVSCLPDENELEFRKACAVFIDKEEK